MIHKILLKWACTCDTNELGTLIPTFHDPKLSHDGTYNTHFDNPKLYLTLVKKLVRSKHNKYNDDTQNKLKIGIKRYKNQ